ncbi:MAG: alkaline phosphatase family protein [Actinomycetota bacterium]
MHLADITPSIFAGLGLPDEYSRALFGESPHGRECLFLIDGCGNDVVEKFSEHAPFLASLKKLGEVETSFPSTTATSLTTLTTGKLPGVHGMLGYTVRVPRSGGRVLNALKWDERVDPQIWQPVPTLFERATAHGIRVSHVAAKRYEGTGFTRATFRGAEYLGANVLTEMIERTRSALQSTPSFAYVYVNDLDVAGHADGVGSEKWLLALATVDRIAQSLRDNLPIGTRFWVTSDHGMINASEKVVLGDNNLLLEGVETIAGEPRARHIYLQESHLDPSLRLEVESTWRDFFGSRAIIYSREEGITAGLFGNSVSVDSEERMGDLIAIAQEGLVIIDPARESLESKMVGHHGALSVTESLVPLLGTQIGS